MAIETLSTPRDDALRDLVERLAEGFPELMTETRGEDGSLRRSVDFDKLRQLLGDRAVDGPQERYQLDWPGKREALALSNASVDAALRPYESESVEFASTANLFVEGDNLDALKLMREGYLGKIDMIYIDPPYNTGSDLIYKDSFKSAATDFKRKSGYTNELGERLVHNAPSNGRFHSDWLSMIYPRLRIARQLLRDGGLIFISIDDNERANLQKICEEIFGHDNFLGCFVWKRRSGAMDAVTNLSEDHEYVLIYSKSQAVLKGVERTFEKYTNPDNDPRGPWISDNLSAGKPGGDTYYPITDPDTGSEFYPPKGRYWPYSRHTMAGKIAEGKVIFPKSAGGTPMLKRFASEAIKSTLPVSSWIERPGANAGQSTLVTPMNSSATKALKELFDAKLFSFPKPVELIKALMSQGMPKDGVVLDFFAGSATTAQAMFECNAEDGGNRRAILVQLPEVLAPDSDAFKEGFGDIAQLSKERIRRSGSKVLQGDCHPDWNRDVGFRVLKVDSSNLKQVHHRPDQTAQRDLLDSIDNVKPDRGADDLLFQVLVDWGLELTLPIRRAIVREKTVFFVDGAALAACFDAEGGIDESFVKELTAHKPLRAVFRDAGFKDSAAKINVEQLFKLLSPATELRCI